VQGRILTVDDEPRVGVLLTKVFRAEGLEAESSVDPEEALRLLKERPFDIVITDLCMPRIDGLEMLRRARSIRPGCEVVVMTGYASVETAREALKRGAVDYITKPFSLEGELKPLVRSILQAPAQEEMEGPLEGLGAERPEALENVVGDSESICSAIEKAGKIARSSAPVLLRGESGTGKEIFANLIHSLSPRASRPLIKVNCAALPESLLESELFGYTKGAFTGADGDRVGLFQAADRGTIFLDEIGEISPTFQPKLLRVLQDGEFHRVGEARRTVKVDVRVMAATNRNLEEAVSNGSFREDLYYRLNVIPLALPPLRDHIEDLPALIDHLVRNLRKGGRVHFSDEALEAMQSYHWPGNVRELANAVEYALVLGDPVSIGLGDLPVAIQDAERLRNERSLSEQEEAGTLEEIEMRCILQAMAKTEFNRTRAAGLLGITRRTLGYRIGKYDLEHQLETIRRGAGGGGGRPVTSVRRGHGASGGGPISTRAGDR
jgi:two-component system NtrC family response regulator